MAYLTGWGAHGSERLTLLFVRVDGRLAALVPKLEEQGARETFERNGVACEIFSHADEDGPQRALSAALSALDLPQRGQDSRPQAWLAETPSGAAARVGVEPLTLRYFELQALLLHGYSFASIEHVARDLRLVKDNDEIHCIERAAAIVDDGLRAVIPLLRAGMTELEVAAELEYQMKRLGSAGTPFATLVGSGPRGALPHCAPTERVIQAGELVVLDYGASVSGYAADTTRTLAWGEPPAFAREVYELVRQAQATAVAACGPGKTAQEIDRAAREVIAAAGHGQHFTHRTGHGLGLEVHEFPSIVAGNDLALVPGMVFTVEPGVYIAQQLGVRIEDDVLIEADGARLLTGFTRELVVVG
jgi:Xaa-Pro aminopeptidase